MKKLILWIGLSIVMTTACIEQKEKPMPPKPKKVLHEMTMHGHKRVDNYFWMNDRQDSAVLSHLNAENLYLENYMAHTKSLQDELFNEIKSKIKQEDKSVPYKKNGYYYYTKTLPEKEYFVFYRKKDNLEADEEVLLDVNKMAEDYEYYQLGGTAVSPDNKIIAYGVDTVSRRKYTIYFKNIETGKLLTDQIPLTTGGIVWANDNQTVFYTLKDDVTLRSAKIMKHKLGTPIKQDQEVYYEADDTFNTFVSKTTSKKYIIIGSESTLTTEYRYLDANNPDGKFKIIQPRVRGLEYQPDHLGDYFYIITNADDATNFKLVKTSVNKTEKGNWKEVIPHRKDVFLSGFDLFKDYLVLNERKEGVNRIQIMPWEGESYYINFDEKVYTASSNVNAELDTDTYRFSYTSMTTPHSTYDFNMKTKERTLLKQQEILGNFDKSNYETKRIYAKANDGTKIPMSIVYKKGLEKNGNNPALLYGYGSYGHTINPTFRLSILPLLDRGFIFAVAHIRGSQIYGRKWYEDGKLLKKMNTFTDFNNCAEHLINEKYTDSNKLFANGGSAGGLLMGAIVNLQSELYKGVIADVPFVDVVTTMLDESIPLTTGEYDEWGNPNNKEYYDYMLSYSPYDNVESKNYPAMLVTTGLHDSQVQYFEPAKWVAKLRELKTDDNPILFHINMDYGHSGASGRFQWIKDTALEYAFILDQLEQNK